MSDAHIDHAFGGKPSHPSPSRKKLGWGRRLALGLVLASVLGTSGCNRYGWELFRVTAEVVAAVAVTAAVLSWHDHHYHHAHCGHRYVVVESRPVYYYGGHWEYYDDYDGRWYYYPDGVE